MTKVICPLCHGTSFVTRHARGRYVARACRTCGLWVCGPQPSAAPRNDTHHYHEVVAERLGVGIEQTSEKLIAAVKTRGGQGHWHDIGCGTGQLIALAQRRGFSVSGTEAMPDACAFADESVRRRIRIFDIESEALTPDTADVISLVQVIEHLRTPIRTLQEVARTLRPNGLLYLETPNIRALSRLTRRRPWIETNLAPGHWHLFNPSTLAQTAQSAGLEVLDVWTFFKGLGLRSRRPRLGRVALRILNESVGRGGVGNCVALIARRRPQP